MTEIIKLNFDDVVIDNSFNPRQGALDQLAIEDYAAAVDELPPMHVFELIDGTHLLVAGFHRIAAHRHAGRSEAEFVVHSGSRQEAEEYADLDNLKHGIQLTRAEKREVIKRQLKRHPGWSDVRIAMACYSTDKTVRSVREELEAKSEIPRMDVLEGADGIKHPRSVSRPAPVKQDEHTVPMAMPSPKPSQGKSPPQGEGGVELRPRPEEDPEPEPVRKPAVNNRASKPAKANPPPPPPPPVPKKLDMPAPVQEEKAIRVVINIKPESRMCMLSLGPEMMPPVVFKSVAFEGLLDELRVLLAEHVPEALPQSLPQALPRPLPEGGEEEERLDGQHIPEEVPEWLGA